MIDGVAMKDKWVSSQQNCNAQALERLHSNHLGIEKTRLCWDTIYWINMNTYIENAVESCSTCLQFQQAQQKEKVIPHKIPGKPLEVIGADLFTISNSYFFCVLHLSQRISW